MSENKGKIMTPGHSLLAFPLLELGAHFPAHAFRAGL